jgi:calcium-dependent protein kinase
MAVAYCHSQSIMHRDLKPENILLEFNSANDKQNFSIKLIDFGTSVIFKPKQKMSEKTGTPYYIAPEILRKRYDEKCDLWSCGVILYILLTGEPPFNGNNDKEILKSVEIGIYDERHEAFKYISEDGRILIKNLLTVDPTKRLSAIEALETKWIKDLAPNSKLNEQEASKILSRLKTFRADQKLQEATLAFIVNQLISKEETNELKKVFMELDVNNDGKLSLEEIAQGYKKIYGSKTPEYDAKLIFESVDADHNGYIGYEEFIRATVDRNKILTDQKLESAFRLFDKNGDGFISAVEIKEVLGKDTKLNDEIWKSIVKEVDVNGDGEISLEEFKTMMQKIINES